MIKSLQLHTLLKKAVAVSLYNGIHTDSVLLTAFKRRKIPRARLNKRLNVKIRDKILQEDSDYHDEIIEEDELNDEIDDLNMLEFDEDVRKRKRLSKKDKLKITAQRFFSPRPQPSMLTYNERLCIQYLHKQDPIQWSYKTLSESFPATPDTIRKILNCKREVTPERAKKIDLRVQKNWELLSEGKLDADAHVIEHLKRFVNRRKVLLEQIKNEAFYLPEIKDEPVWNQGEMNSIIIQYEKDVERLVQESNPKAVTDGSEDKEEEEKKSNLDLLQAQIKAKSEDIPVEKDNFIFGNMLKSYSKCTTSEELESDILKKAENRKKLDLKEMVILNDKLKVKKDNYKKVTKSSTLSGMKEMMTHDSECHEMTERITQNLEAEKKVQKKFEKVKGSSSSSERMEPKEFSEMLDYTLDERVHFGHETNISKVLHNLQNKPQPEVKPIKTEGKKEIDFSESERRKRENAHYDKEVLDIKDTAFWNNKRSSKEKAMAEFEKGDLDGPSIESMKSINKIPKIFVFSPDPYPERIRIPRSKRGSGLTFRVKDCYYDDDGEFLYRVPGMT